jgi:CubicO group peptidase (beta-lactamase class C family)
VDAADHHAFQAARVTRRIAADTTRDALMNASESDPARLPWMQGAPPPAELRVQLADMSHFQFPRTRWTFANIRQLLPTTQVWRGAGPASALPEAPNRAERAAAIDRVIYQPIGGAEAQDWQHSLDANFTDAIVVLHQGCIVYEAYRGLMQPHRAHMAFSVTKSYTGTLAAMLLHEGLLDDQAPVTRYLPELADTAYGDATVRQVMDMQIGVAYSEDYTDPQAGVWEHARAGGTLPRPPDYAGAQSYFAYLQTLRKQGEHGQDFHYKTVNTDVLGWLLRRATGLSFGELLSQRLWQPLGTEEDASLLVDTEGTEFAGGGLSACVRDLARFGECLRQDGHFNGRQIVPQAVVEDIRFKGQAQAFKAKGPPTLPGGAYRSMWWLTNNEHGAYAARGIHGQAIYVDPTAQMTIARFASHPMAANAHIDPHTLPAFHALAKCLMANAA